MATETVAIQLSRTQYTQVTDGHATLVIFSYLGTGRLMLVAGMSLPDPDVTNYVDVIVDKYLTIKGIEGSNLYIKADNGNLVLRALRS